MTFVSPPPSPPLQDHPNLLGDTNLSSSLSNTPVYTTQNQIEVDIDSTVSLEETHLSIIQPTCNMAIHGNDDNQFEEESFMEA